MSALAAMAGFGSVLIYSFGVLLKPLGMEFGWSRATISVAFACASFTPGLCSPGLGVLLDRHGPRRVILPCVAVFGIALGSRVFLSGSGNDSPVYHGA
jgi:MFS-type transporter involved in bile tolerance (Atg22 family)